MQTLENIQATSFKHGAARPGPARPGSLSVGTAASEKLWQFCGQIAPTKSENMGGCCVVLVQIRAKRQIIFHY